MLNTVIKLSSLSFHAGLLEGMTPERAHDIAVEAAKQGVVGWVLVRLKEDYQSEPGFDILKAELFKRTLVVFAQNQRNVVIINEIYRLLNAEGIDVVLLKGAALMTSYYPQTTLRQIGDIDVWIDARDIYRAREILIANGAVSTDTDQPVVVDMKHAHLAALSFMGQTLELHHRLYRVAVDMEMPNPLSCYVESHGNYRVLGEQAMFYHLLTHAGYNTRREGLRVGWIVDILFMLSQSDNPESLISFVRQSNPRADDYLYKIVGMAMMLMTDEMKSRYVSLGFSQVEFNSDGELKKMSTMALKYFLLSEKIRDFCDRLSMQRGMQAKCNEVKLIFTHEVERTRKAYPDSSLFVGIFRRVFGRGIVKRRFDGQ